MSTRAAIHFQFDSVDYAIISRHCDGYPEGLGKDIQDFLDDVSELEDNRFGDPSYLAAKWVVWDSQRTGTTVTLDFLGVGIVMEDPGDIEYKYLVECHNGDKRPEVKCVKV